MQKVSQKHQNYSGKLIYRQRYFEFNGKFPAPSALAGKPQRRQTRGNNLCQSRGRKLFRLTQSGTLGLCERK